MELRICEFNVENLFLSMEYYAGEDLGAVSEEEWRSFALAQLRDRQKPIAKVRALAATIRDIDPDVLMLVEVGGRESLERFNRHFLGGDFEEHFVETNSARGIDLGFLVRRGLSLRAETRSHKDTPIEVYSMGQGKYTSRFSRNIGELRLSGDSGLELILLLVHLKSKLGTEHDVLGKDVRTAEAFALADHYQALRRSHPGVPVVVGGDFNTSLESLELELLKRTDLTDFHDALATPESERVSLVHFSYSGSPRPLVLDYLLISPHLKDRLVASGSYTYRYKGFYDIPDEPPQNRAQRARMPSDHFPLVVTFRL